MTIGGGWPHSETQWRNKRLAFLVTMLQLGLIWFCLHGGWVIVRICSCGETIAPNVAQNKKVQRQQRIHRLHPSFKNTALMTLMMANTTWAGSRASRTSCRGGRSLAVVFGIVAVLVVLVGGGGAGCFVGLVLSRFNQRRSEGISTIVRILDSRHHRTIKSSPESSFPHVVIRLRFMLKPASS